MYAAYNKTYFKAMEPGLKVKDSFEKLSNTDFWEKYMLNAFQFSAAKNATEMKMLQQNVFNENKERRSFSEFKNLPETQAVLENFNGPDYWIRAEYDLASQGAVMAEKWEKDSANKDVNPYWIYICADEPCDICEPLDGMIFKYDEASDELFPPNHFNCGCSTEPTDDAGEDEENLTSPEDIESGLAAVPEQFQGNVGKDGIFQLEGSSYAAALPNANDADSEMFGTSKIGKTFLNTTKYNDSAKRLTVNEWSHECMAPKSSDLLFRNHDWLLNVRLSQSVIKKISGKGFQNIRQTVEKPDEVWAKWDDPKKQKAVRMFYFLHSAGKEKQSYIVETLQGKVVDAYFRTHNDSKNLRKLGIKMIK
jgi:SPP1 gp7 family putative phage head morphogenesis protein